MMKLLTLAAFGAAAAITGTHPQGSVSEQGAEEIRRIAVAVSDPTSPTYGEFLTRQQVAAMAAEKTEDMAAVTGWLTAKGVKLTIRSSNVAATMSVAHAPRRPHCAVALGAPPAPPIRSPHNRWGAAVCEQRDRSCFVFSCTTAAAQFSGGVTSWVHHRFQVPTIVGAPLRASSGIEVALSSAARQQQHSSLAG